jgi:Flp pilus assembly protein CpaB
MTYRVRNIVIAVVLAALAALMTSFYVTNYKRHVQQGEDHVQVFVASRDIPAGTPGSEAVRMLTSKQVTRAGVTPGAIASKSEISSLVASQRVYAGEQATLNRFSSVAQGGVRGDLKGNMRAIQIAGDANQTLAGTLRPGDHVDLLANLKYKFVNFRGKNNNTAASDDLVASRIVLRDLKVLRPAQAGTADAVKLGSTGGNFPVMLEVSDFQAQKLFFVVKNGDWSLQLRPVVDATDSPEGVETVGSVLGDGLHKAQLDELVFGTRG